MLDKRLKLGGLQVGSPRTMQNVARFRVADNVYQTRDDIMVPRFHCVEEIDIATANFPQAQTLATYNKFPFSVVRNISTNRMMLFYNSTKIPMYGIAASDFSDTDESNGLGTQCLEKLGNLYVHFPYYGLYKYDGTQAYKAGVPLPYFDSAQRNPAGTAYIRIIQHHIDFQGNIVNSGYIQFRATPSASLVNIQMDKTATEICGNSEVTPKIRTSRLDGNYDEHYFVSTGVPTVNAGPRTVTCPTGGNHNVALNAYVMIYGNGVITAANSGLATDTVGIAVKVVATTATTVTFSLDNVKYLDATKNWATGAMSTAFTGWGLAITGTNYWMSGWASNTATGNYVLRGVFKAFYNSTTAQTFALDCTSLTSPNNSYADINAFNLSGNLGDIYDVTTVKDVFPYFSTWNSTEFPITMTTYGDMALIADDSNVRFSDTSLGGSFEMVNGLSFITVGDGNDGKIQAICGNADFLLVSRQNQNYYVSGNLPTANYRVQKINGTSMGAITNESVYPYEDKIMMFNCQGVWAIYTGARCEEISMNIRGLFQDWSDTFEWPEEAYFDISEYPEFVTLFTHPDNWVRARADKQRGLLVFLISGTDKSGVALVLNMNNGEFYTWSSLNGNFGLADSNVKDILFIDGSYKVAINSKDGSDFHAGIYEELKTGPDRYDYESVAPVKLETTWFTAGEPSLEKKLNQVKIWGKVTCPVAVKHLLDWTTDEIVDSNYDKPNNVLFSHKHQLKPANFQAVSVGLQPTISENRFEIEGIEIEFQLFQQGMKR